MSNPAISGTNYAVVNALLQTKGDEEGWKYFEALNKNVDYYSKTWFRSKYEDSSW